MLRLKLGRETDFLGGSFFYLGGAAFQRGIRIYIRISALKISEHFSVSFSIRGLIQIFLAKSNDHG